MSVKLSSPQAFRVVKYLLGNPIAYQRRIHRDLGISLGWINTVVNTLCEAGIARKGKWRRIELEDPYSLLDLLSWQRPLQRLIEATVRLESTETRDVERELREVCIESGSDYALTAFSGLTRYLAYYMTFPTVHTYAESPEKIGGMLTRGRGPVTLEVIRPDHGWILEETSNMEGFVVVDPVQVVIDLFCLGSAGRDAATRLYERIRDEQQKID